LRSALLWVVTQCILAIPYRYFGITYQSFLLDFVTLAGGTKGLTQKSEDLIFMMDPEIMHPDSFSF
jgi:hypothetical protein